MEEINSGGANMTTDDPIELEIEIQAEYTTEDDIAKMTTNLYREINESEVESVDRVKAGPAPKGTKSGDVVTIGTLAVQVLPAVLPGLFSLVQDWVARGRGARTIKFKYGGIEYEGSRDDLEKILEKLEKGKKKK